MQKTNSFEAFGDRYRFDFKRCTASNGWAQIDSKQDAPYYGQWANPITCELASYCEGDVTHTKCADEAEFIAALGACLSWNKERGYLLGIDGMCRPEIIEAFQRLGFGEYLH
jgi:hypothetical protein